MINYYEILNVSKTATSKEINKAYKRAAFKWHPDKNKSSDASERMIVINEARLILIDEEARIKYDIELEKFQSFTASQTGLNKEEYIVTDELLFKWMKNAKTQAKLLAKCSLEDLVGASKAGVSAFYHKTKFAIVLYIVIIILVLMFL